jgi:hypothetical protein
LPDVLNPLEHQLKTVDGETYYVVIFDPRLIAVRQLIFGQEFGILGSKDSAKGKVTIFTDRVDCVTLFLDLETLRKVTLTLGRIISRSPAIPNIGMFVQNDIGQTQRLASPSGAQPRLSASNDNTVVM